MQAFSSLALLHIMEFPLNILVNTTNFVIQCNVSLRRIVDFLTLHERDE